MFKSSTYVLWYLNFRSFSSKFTVNFFILSLSKKVFFLATWFYTWTYLYKWTAFVFGSTYLHQNVYLINKNISMYCYARCNCMLWKVIWFCCRFWIFSYIINKYLCLKYCISTKLSQIVCLINKNGRFSD